MDVVPQAPPQSRSSAWRAWWRRAFYSIRDRNARGWYFGACFGLLFQGFTIVAVWLMPTSVAQRVITTFLLAIFYTGFMVLPPMLWWSRRNERLIVIGIYWLASFAFFPLMGSLALWLWVLVAVDAAVIFEEFLIVASITTVLVAIPLIYGIETGFSDSAPYSAIVTFSVASMMFGMNKQIRAVRELREAQGEVARLAVVDERARFSRDMHDMLGHSLTVVTVKSELARRLVALDPARAEAEIADIERLSRSALADLRAAVAGYREMSLSTELAAAQATLAAAEIEAHLPRNGEAAAPELRELFGWVLREGVTNVIRHSGAKNCWVQLGRYFLTIADDGAGLPADESASGPDASAAAASGPAHPPGGTGIDGLSARARAVGARLTISSSEHGGLELTVQKARS